MFSLRSIVAFNPMQTMLYDPYSQPAIDIDELATQCRNCIKPTEQPPAPVRVWDCQNGRWIRNDKE